MNQAFKGDWILRKSKLNSESLFAWLTAVVKCKKTCPILIRRSYLKLTLHKSPTHHLYLHIQSLTHRENVPYRDSAPDSQRKTQATKWDFLNCRLSEEKYMTKFLLILFFLFWCQRKRYFCFRVFPCWNILLFYSKSLLLISSFPYILNISHFNGSVMTCQMSKFFPCSLLVHYR